MVFTSLAFVELLSVVLIVLTLCRTRWQRQLAILIASLIFYGSWNVHYLLLLATPSVIDYFCALRIDETDEVRRRKAWLAFSVLSNLGLLSYFKYTNFFVQSFAKASGYDLPTFHILLPVGISFYTFKTMSYTIDVYRRHIRPCRSWWQYAMFVTYFPELVAGPIVRASVFLPQMSRSLRPSGTRLCVGLQIVALGFSKKLLIADRLAGFVDPVLAHPAVYSSATIWAAVVAYSLQIYCDFSGYSDIAIGVSRIIGFDLPENFNMPYAACSITEFWRRWHMTLSLWLRDYLYIPLGGNRKGKLRTYLNLTITMLLGGLWHGASWTFVAWGALHGLGLAAHKFWLDGARHRSWRVPRPVGWIATYTFVCLSWVLFRAQDFAAALELFAKMFGVGSPGVTYVYLPLLIILPIVVAAHYIGAIANSQAREASGRSPTTAFRRLLYAGGSSWLTRRHSMSGVYTLLPRNALVLGFCTTVWFAVLYFFAPLDSSPFIYFQF